MQIGACSWPLASTRGISVAFAIYNTSLALSGLCHFTGIAITSRRRMRVRRPVIWLIAAYASLVGVMGVVIHLAFTGKMPVFFVEGQGGTPVRSLVVSATVVILVLAAKTIWRANRRAWSSFVHWYALGLALLAVGLAGSLLLIFPDSPLQLATRSTQALGSVYMCVAILSSVRRSGSWRFSIEEALRESEERFRTLFASMNEGCALCELVYDEDRTPCDFRYLEVNPAFDL